MIFIVFGGVYVNADNVPAALKWLPNISMIKYCFEACAPATIIPVAAAAPCCTTRKPLALAQRQAQLHCRVPSVMPSPFERLPRCTAGAVRERV